MSFISASVLALLQAVKANLGSLSSTGMNAVGTVQALGTKAVMGVAKAPFQAAQMLGTRSMATFMKLKGHCNYARAAIPMFRKKKAHKGLSICVRAVVDNFSSSPSHLISCFACIGPRRSSRHLSRRRSLTLHAKAHGVAVLKPRDWDRCNPRPRVICGPPVGYSRKNRPANVDMSLKAIRYGEDLIRPSQKIFAKNNCPQVEYFTKEEIRDEVHVVVDLINQRVLNHGLGTKRPMFPGAYYPPVPNPLPLITEWLLHIIHYKKNGYSFELPHDRDFYPFVGLTPEYVNAKILPKLRDLLLLPNMGSARRATVSFPEYFKFLQQAFLRRLDDRRIEAKKVHPEDSDDEDMGGYFSDVPIKKLMPKDWNDIFDCLKENYSDVESDGDSDDEL
ncbi:MAG: hypothetical protein SGILL_001383 [Bacillariaceae sp.]